jgi:hypothetical protein
MPKRDPHRRCKSLRSLRHVGRAGGFGAGTTTGGGGGGGGGDVTVTGGGGDGDGTSIGGKGGGDGACTGGGESPIGGDGEGCTIGGDGGGGTKPSEATMPLVHVTFAPRSQAGTGTVSTSSFESFFSQHSPNL